MIYLAKGTGTYSEADGVNLLNGQTLIGAGEALTITADRRRQPGHASFRPARRRPSW